MKKGINEEAGIPAEWRNNRDEEFKKISNAGFDGIELVWEKPFSEEEKKSLLEASEKYSLEIIGLVTPLFWQYTLSSTDAETRKRGGEILRQLVSDAADLKAETVLCVPGTVGSATPYLDAYENSKSTIIENLPFIEKTGVTVCIENVWNKFLTTAVQVRDFVDEIGSPFVKAYLDAGNVLINSYPQDWVRVLGERVRRLHVKDFKNGIGNITGFTDLLLGDLNWHALNESLKEVGYDGYMTIEIPYYPLAPELFLKQESEKLDCILAM